MEYKNISNIDKTKIQPFIDEYKTILGQCKTEQEWVEYIRVGSTDIKNLKDDELYFIKNNQHSCILFKPKFINNELQPFNIIASHIDSPRIDIKPNPLYEDKDIALFKSHYYGGIKTYQWSCIPLEIRGIIYTLDNKKLDCKEIFKDNTFVISDLLPHLSDEQDKRTSNKTIKGEELNIIVGSIQIKTEKDKVKSYILQLLKEKGIEEEDISCSDIRFVPKFNPEYVGFDNGLIGGYGQDDRVCAYTSYKALIDTSNNNRSIMCIFADKEEIGSIGISGMRSNWWLNYLQEIFENNKLLHRDASFNEFLRKCFCISADVDGAIDPTFSEPFEINNACYINRGITIEKDGASGSGKYFASECPGELANKLRILFKNNNINYQVVEMGNVDTGAGGTVAEFIADKGINVIDCGCPVLSMHSPYELTSIFDIYECYKAYKVFFEKWN